MRPAAFPPGRLSSLGIDPAWSRSIDVPLSDGIASVHVLDAGPGGGDVPLTVVCVHGNPTWSILWRSFHSQLGDRYRVLAIDQPSMGFSQRVPPRRFAQRVDDLGRILDAFEVEGPVVLAAHDWGGPIALGWAVAHPDRVKGILLANTGVSLPATGVPPLIRLAGSRALRSLACRSTPLFVHGTLRAPGRRIPRDVKQAYVAPYASARDRAAIEEFVEDIPVASDHPSYHDLADVAGRLGELDVPVLLAWGERDPVFHSSFAADLMRRLPRAEIHRFPLAGHLVVEEEDVAALADAWLDQVLEPGRDATPLAPASGQPRLWDALVEREGDADVALAVAGVESLSFSALAKRVATLADGLVDRGVRAGDRVAVLTPEPQDFVAAAYACWAIGAVVVVVDRGLGRQGIQRALRSARPSWLLGTRTTLAVARALRFAPEAVRLDIGELRGQGSLLSAVVERHPPTTDSLAAVAYTSGATGPAKGVLYTQRQMAAQFSAVRDCYGIGPDDRLVAAFAPFALYGPALGIPVAVPDCDITKPAKLRAEALASACASVGATIVFAAPAALDGVLASSVELSPAGWEALASLRLVLSAGAPVSRRLLEEFSLLAPSAELHTPYGMTEVLSVADIDLEALIAVGSGSGVCVGHPLAGVEVRIEPLDGATSTGEIVVSAPWQSSGYDGLWATNARSREVDAAGVEWHRTGDVGNLDEDGRLWVEGRMAHVVETSDGPVTPVPLELRVEAALGSRAAVAGVGPSGCQQVVVVVELDRRAGLAPPDLDQVVRAAAEPRAVAAVLTVRAFPVDRRHNSKIDRTRLGRFAEAVLAGGSAPRRP